MASRLFSRNLAAVPRAPLRSAAVPRRFASSGGAVTKDPILLEQEHHKAHAAKTADLWRKISMYACVPGAIVLGVFIYQIETAHLQHHAHELAMNGGELPEEGKPKYEYQNIRKKPFAWGMQSFFFNEKINYPAEL